ncbi:MAG: sulfotransferase family 2 domain-containing protein [Octadecabacter sp.]
MFNRHFSPNSLLMEPENKTLFVLNPKVMTSFSKRLFRDGHAKFRSGDPSGGRYRWLKRARHFPFQPVRNYIALNFSQSDLSVYTLVRNPYVRTFSAWRDKFYDPHVFGGGDTANYPRSMRDGVLMDFRRFARKQGLDGAEDRTLVPFSTFVARLKDQKEGRRNHHWDTQTSVVQFQHFSFERCFRMEDERHACFQTVFTRFGFDPDWIVSRLATPVNASQKGNDPKISLHDLKQLKDVLDVDFHAFGYSDEIPKTLTKYIL